MTETLHMPPVPDLSDGPPGGPADGRADGPSASRRTSWLRRLGDDTTYALTAMPIGLVAFVLVLVGTVAGVSLAWLAIGLPVLAAAVLTARGFAHLERLRLRSLQGRVAAHPEYATAAPGAGWWRRVLTPLRDPQSWLDVVWSVVGFATGLTAAVVTFCWYALVVGGATYWFWQRWLPESPDNVTLASLIGLGEGRQPEIWLNTFFGLVALVTLPLVVRLMALLHSGLATALLCSRAELQGQVRREVGGRSAAREAEAGSMRRLERDLHDGPQQRMVRVAMDLGRARHADDPAVAQAALDAAYEQTRTAIEELRALSRGIAPPLLVDRGLAAAVEELVTRSAEDVHLAVDLPAGLGSHTEAAAYFVVAEALTNVAKHSGATRVDVVVGVDPLDPALLLVEVRDDGVGGAHTAKGSGLAGLVQRVRGLDGMLDLDSPAGGPTVLRALLPLDAGAATDAGRDPDAGGGARARGARR